MRPLAILIALILICAAYNSAQEPPPVPTPAPEVLMCGKKPCPPSGTVLKNSPAMRYPREQCWHSLGAWDIVCKEVDDNGNETGRWIYHRLVPEGTP